jgi:hypothetical protein
VTPGAGPDGRANSAFTLGANLNLGNAAITAGLLMLWRESGVTGFGINGLTLVASSEFVVNGYQLIYYRGAIPSGIILPSGFKLFDVRLYATSVSVDAITYYAENVINHHGDVFLP